MKGYEKEIAESLEATRITTAEVEANVDVSKLLECYAIEEDKTRDGKIKLAWTDNAGKREGVYDGPHRTFLVDGHPMGILEFYALLEGFENPDAALAALASEKAVQKTTKEERKKRRALRRFFAGKTFIPMFLGDELRRRRPFMNLTKQAGPGHLFSYEGGVYRQDGRVAVEEMTAEILGSAYRDNRRNETEACIRAMTYTDPETANQYEGFVNVANGMLQWKTGHLLSHSPRYVSTIQLPMEYDSEAKCPVIDKFFATTLPEDSIELALEWFGYCLLPETKYDKALIAVGPGSNGKSTFLNLLVNFLGHENTCTIPLHELDEHRFKRAGLQHKLANVFADLDTRALRRSGYFKLVVSGDWIDGERKYSTPFEFQPFAKLMFSANVMPGSYDKSKAFYRRWLIVPFVNVFEGENADRDLLKKMVEPAELSGLLNRVIMALRHLEQRNRFDEPATVLKALADYKLRSDSMAAFLSERCADAGMGEWVGKVAIYEGYKLWCDAAKIKHIESRIEFNRRLQDMYPMMREKRITTDDGRFVRVWFAGPVFAPETESEPEMETPEQIAAEFDF